MDNLLVTKVGIAFALTAASILGIWAPFFYLLKVIESVSGRSRFQLAEMSHPLSLANCFSAGMLLAMALVHFLSSAFKNAAQTVSSTTLCATVLSGILFPALMECGIDNSPTQSQHGHSHGMCSTYDGQQRPFNVSLIVLLMFFHGALEGILIGLEGSGNALVNSAVPLFIHHFFDGVIISIFILKELCVETEVVDEITPLLSVKNNTMDEFCTKFWSKMQSWLMFLWLCIMPVTLLLSGILTGNVLINSTSNLMNKEHGEHNLQNAMTTTHIGSGNVWLAMAQAAGSGFFIFGGLVMFLQENLRGAPAGMALLLGVLLVCLLKITDHH